MQNKELEAQKSLVLAWPSPQDYNEALQNPRLSFSDPELASGQPALDVFGLPKPTSGMFATVYRIRCGDKDWAVRCFLRSRTDQIYRYSAIREALKKAALPCTVHFDLQDSGISVSGQNFPMLKMEWCEGEPLNNWLEDHLKDKPLMEEFLEKWRMLLLDLNTRGIAHGDLQHGNVMITPDNEIKLVDYDGMFVPQFANLQSNELGHPNYQHPARDASFFASNLDNFSGWLIYLSALICACDPHLFFDFDGGDECIIFRKQDLVSPLKSELFYVLEHHHNPQIKEAARLLRYLLSLPPEQVPDLRAPLIVPGEFPQFSGTLSEMPDWVNDAGYETGGESNKILSRRKRRRALPYERTRRAHGRSELMQNSSAQPGRWLYDEQGLVFVPENEAGLSCYSSNFPHVGSNSAPSRQFHTGQLHSPLLDEYLRPEDNSGDPNFCGPKNLYTTEYLRYSKFLFVIACAIITMVLQSLKHSMEQSPGIQPVSTPLSAEQQPENALNNALNNAQVCEKQAADYCKARNWAEAEQLYSQALNSWKLYSGDASSDYADVLIKLARVYAEEKKLDLADASYTGAITRLVKNYRNPDDPHVRDAADRYSEFLAKQGKNADKIVASLIDRALKANIEPLTN